MIIPEDSKIIACGVLLLSKDSKILAFARRGDMKKLGLPAGKREDNELLSTCASRELFEESGIRLDLTNNTEIFYYIPDDKQKEKLDEYCATLVVRSNLDSQDYRLQESNRNENGELEGVAVWVDPVEFISVINSAFLDYNTNLLKFAEPI